VIAVIVKLHIILRKCGNKRESNAKVRWCAALEVRTVDILMYTCDEGSRRVHPRTKTETTRIKKIRLITSNEKK